MLVHITVVITRLADQNKEMIQELGLSNLNRKLPNVPSEIAQKNSDILVIVPAYNEEENIGRVIADLKTLDLDSRHPRGQRRFPGSDLRYSKGNPPGIGGQPAEQPRHRRCRADRVQVGGP